MKELILESIDGGVGPSEIRKDFFKERTTSEGGFELGISKGDFELGMTKLNNSALIQDSPL